MFKPVIFVTVLIFRLVYIIILLFQKLFGGKSKDSTSAAFECGFEPLREMRAPFSTKFFLLLILFVIFDVELAILFPLLINLYVSWGSFDIILWTIGVIILLLGLLVEVCLGKTDWIYS
jgi:NADH-ubiquinone oxidoreductase chain 3